MPSKFSRVVKINEPFETISHQGTTYKEEHEGTGLVEMSHQHADDLVKHGYVQEFAEDMDAALEKLTGAAKPAQQPTAAQRTAAAQGTPNRKL